MGKRTKGPCTWAALLLALIMAIIAPCGVQAQSHSEAYGEGNIYIRIQASNKDAEDLSGVRLAIYEVARGSWAEGQAQLLSDFSEELTQLSMEDMLDHSLEASKQLENRVKSGHPTEPVMTAESNEAGEITFDHLEDGIYLVCQENDEHDFDTRGYSIKVEPYLIELPRMDEDGSLCRDIESEPKAKVEKPSRSVEVEKHWKDDNNKGNFRPESIQVTLYNNGEAEETVTLNAANNWRYVWDNLDNNGTWTVKEDEVPAGYKSTVTSEGNSFVITNELLPNDIDGDAGTTTARKESTTSSKGTTSSKDSTTSGKSSRSSVKTGDITPVYFYLAVLAFAVLLLVLILKRRRIR